MAFCLEYGFFKVFKWHESATVCPIRGAIAGSKHETQSIPCHSGLALQTLRAMFLSSFDIPGLSEKYWMGALSFVSFRDGTREKKSNSNASTKGFDLFPQLRDGKLSSDIALLHRVSKEERRIGTSFNSLSSSLSTKCGQAPIQLVEERLGIIKIYSLVGTQSGLPR